MENEEQPHYLRENRAHGDACHARWMERRNRKIEEEYSDPDWYYEQCLRCSYFMPLMGVLAEDWGACSNEQSAFDGRVMFEHDGCAQFEDAN